MHCRAIDSKNPLLRTTKLVIAQRFGFDSPKVRYKHKLELFWILKDKIGLLQSQCFGAKLDCIFSCYLMVSECCHVIYPC